MIVLLLLIALYQTTYGFGQTLIDPPPDAVGLPGGSPRELSPLDASNFVTCVQMIKDVMATGGTQPGLNLVSSQIYRSTNPGPYPFSYALGSDVESSEDDVRIVHPFLPVATVADTLAGSNGTATERALYAEGFRNASVLAVSSCCNGDLFGFALPFAQTESNEAGSVDLEQNLRWYVASSARANQTDDVFYTACPYTSVPVLPRTNTNFPDITSSASRLAGLLTSIAVAVTLLG